jgi:hypothetical protein
MPEDRCCAEVWVRSAPSHRCTRAADYIVPIDLGGGVIDLCWQHHRALTRPHGGVWAYLPGFSSAEFIRRAHVVAATG